MELLAAVQEAWLVLAQHTAWLLLAQHTVVVGGAVVGVPVVSAPGQPVHSHRPMQVYSIKGTPFLFHCNYKLVCFTTLFKLLG